MTVLEYKNQINKGFFKDEWFILGLDIGDTNCSLSYFNNKPNKVETIDLSMGFGKMPIRSAIQYREEQNEWVFGEEAYSTSLIYPETTVNKCSSLLGLEDKLKFCDDFFTPEEVLSKVIKNIVDNLLKIVPKAEIIGIVVTYSNEITEHTKKSLENALDYIGLKDKLIAQVPFYVSVLQSHLNNITLDKEENILIFDFGGNNLNTSIVNLKDYNANLLNSNSKKNICGNNFDNILLEQFYGYINEMGIDSNSLTNENISELKMKAIETKERLSGSSSSRVPFTFCVPPFMKQLSLTEFESLIEGEIISIKNSIESLIRDTNVCIDRVILTGGSSSMSFVKPMFKELIGDESKILISNSPNLDGSIGATYIGAKEFNLFNNTINFTDNNINTEIELSYDIGIVYNDFIALIKKGSSVHYCKSTTILKTDNDKISFKFVKKLDDTITDIEEVCFDELPCENNLTKFLLSVNLIENGGKLKIQLKEILNERQTHSCYDKICVIAI